MKLKQGLFFISIATMMKLYHHDNQSLIPQQPQCICITMTMKITFVYHNNSYEFVSQYLTWKTWFSVHQHDIIGCSNSLWQLFQGGLNIKPKRLKHTLISKATNCVALLKIEF